MHIYGVIHINIVEHTRKTHLNALRKPKALKNIKVIARPQMQL